MSALERDPAAALEPRQSDRHPRRRGPERYAKAVEIAAKDPDSDGLLVILTPQGMTDPTQTAEQLKPYAKLDGKPCCELDGRSRGRGGRRRF